MKTPSTHNNCGLFTRRPSGIICLLLVGLASASGCGKQSRAPLAAVAGNVTYRGKPLANGTIIFASSHRTAAGKIVNGQIVEVTTYRQNDGAPVGSHQVAIQASEARDDSAVAAHPGAPSTTDGYMGMGKSLIPSRYCNPKTSGLTCEIQAGPNEVAFDLVD